MKRLHASLLALVLFCTVTIGAANPGIAQILIRDAEIERLLHDYSAPIFRAAGLSPETTDVVILDDTAVNAFVAGGQRMYLNTGILLITETPEELMGVIAHETGHIVGGDVIRARAAAEQAMVPMVLSTLMGVAAIAAGAGEAGAGLITAGQQFGRGQFMSFSRAQEAAADQAAAEYLEQAGVPVEGLLRVLDELANQNVLGRTLENSYTLTHPLSRERIALLERRARNQTDASVDPELQERHDRMRAKIRGFLRRPENTLNLYPPSDTSVPARYARAIAYQRLARLDDALSEIDSLIAETPEDPFFHELKGQILFESGRIEEAIGPYQRALELAPDEPLIKIALGKVLVQAGGEDRLQDGARFLEAGLGVDDEFAPAWQSLAVAYDRLGMTGMAQLASAERLVRQNKIAEAKMLAGRAMETLPNGSPGWLRASDIQSMIDPRANDRR